MIGSPDLKWLGLAWFGGGGGPWGWGRGGGVGKRGVSFGTSMYHSNKTPQLKKKTKT